MIDIKLIRTNPELVKENIKKKFQDEKLELVDKVVALDEEYRKTKTECDSLRNVRKVRSKEIGGLMAKGLRDEAEKAKAEVIELGEKLTEMEALETKLEGEIKEIMMVIPNIIDDSVPIGKDDSENVEVERFGEPAVPDFEVPYHVDIMEKVNGIDIDSARSTSGNGFYYLKGDIAQLQSCILSYARDFMIDKGFTYYIPPFMIRSAVVTGVMSFDDMANMMYKIEGEDLYLIGTSEQEMVVVCKPEESMDWFHKLYSYTVEFFRTLDIPVRTLECCSGDLADLKVKSIDVEAWSPRQKKYFEVGSCSNLGDAQARRLSIRVKAEDGTKYFPHTLNNTVVAPPRMLIAFVENNLNEDGSIRIPKALQPYMRKEVIKVPEKK